MCLSGEKKVEKLFLKPSLDYISGFWPYESCP